MIVLALNLDIFRRYHTTEIAQVVDSQNLIAYPIKDYGTDRDYFWLNGMETAGIADRQHISIKGLWLVDGTKSFASSDGTKRTLLLIKPFDISPYWSTDVGKAVAKFVDDQLKSRKSQ